MVGARWGAAAFAKNQARIVCSNTFDPSQEPVVPSNVSNFGLKVIDQNTFMGMVQWSFVNASCEEDLLAPLKRSTIVIFENHGIYLRRAGARPVPVQVISYPNGEDTKDVLTPQCKERLGQYNRGEHVMAEAADLE